jgi:hypothetical protein
LYILYNKKFKKSKKIGGGWGGIFSLFLQFKKIKNKNFFFLEKILFFCKQIENMPPQPPPLKIIIIIFNLMILLLILKK